MHLVVIKCLMRDALWDANFNPLLLSFFLYFCNCTSNYIQIIFFCAPFANLNCRSKLSFVEVFVFFHEFPSMQLARYLFFLLFLLCSLSRSQSVSFRQFCNAHSDHKYLQMRINSKEKYYMNAKREQNYFK